MSKLARFIVLYRVAARPVWSALSTVRYKFCRGQPVQPLEKYTHREEFRKIYNEIILTGDLQCEILFELTVDCLRFGVLPKRSPYNTKFKLGELYMNSYQKVESMQVPAVHPVWGKVTIVSKWQNKLGHVLHQVAVQTESGLARMFTVKRFTSLLEGGAQ